MPVMDKPKYLTVEEVSEELRVSTETVLRWIRKKELPAYKFGGVYRITPADFEQFQKTRRTKPEKNSNPSQES